MHNQYAFSTSGFGLSGEGIHLLRNGFNHTTLEFKKITAIEIKQGMDSKNWWWVLVVGVVLAGYGIFDIAQVLNIFNDEETKKIYIERIVLPLFPLLLGIYSIVIAFRKTKVMIVRTDEKGYYLSLREIMKAKQFDPFLVELKKQRSIQVM